MYRPRQSFKIRRSEVVERRDVIKEFSLQELIEFWDDEEDGDDIPSCDVVALLREVVRQNAAIQDLQKALDASFSWLNHVLDEGYVTRAEDFDEIKVFLDNNELLILDSDEPLE